MVLSMCFRHTCCRRYLLERVRVLRKITNILCFNNIITFCTVLWTSPPKIRPDLIHNNWANVARIIFVAIMNAPAAAALFGTRCALNYRPVAPISRFYRLPRHRKHLQSSNAAKIPRENHFVSPYIKRKIVSNPRCGFRGRGDILRVVADTFEVRQHVQINHAVLRGTLVVL